MPIDYSRNALKEKDILMKSSHLHWMHWLVIVASIILTLSAWYISKTSIEKNSELQFERQAQQAVALIQERIIKYEDALWAGVAMIQSNGGDVSHPRWRSFAENLSLEEKYPGINGIGVIHFISESEKENYLQQQRTLRPDYHIHPEHHRDEFWPITYIEPENMNSAAVGLDMAHETNRYRAALAARESGNAQITAPITLVQDANQTPGFLFYAPFYKKGPYETPAERISHFTGMVYAPFIFEKLMEGTLSKKNRLIGIKIKDNDYVLYNEHQSNFSDYDPNPLFSKQYEIDIYGRNWKFDIRSALSFRQAVKNNQPVIILIGGVIIDILLVTLFILLTNANRRAKNILEKVLEN
jgi:CHASE1-domain containing sensor protein